MRSMYWLSQKDIKCYDSLRWFKFFFILIKMWERLSVYVQLMLRTFKLIYLCSEMMFVVQKIYSCLVFQVYQYPLNEMKCCMHRVKCGQLIHLQTLRKTRVDNISLTLNLTVKYFCVTEKCYRMVWTDVNSMLPPNPCRFRRRHYSQSAGIDQSAECRSAPRRYILR